MVLKWNEQALAAIRRFAPPPPAAEKTLGSLFAGMAGDFKAFREALGYTDLPSGQASDPAEIGVRAADNVIASRAGDNSNQANNYADTSGYVPGISTTVIPSLRWVPWPVRDSRPGTGAP